CAREWLGSSPWYFDVW
nr:immunoglobulin heavy chain junction region [Mus musculus]MBK4188355.1 immunoglobulin heavy chain junction region [Mus musculus]